MNESLEHNYPCSFPLSCTSSIPPSLFSRLPLSRLQEKSVKGAAAEIFIDLFSSVLFISLSLPNPACADPRNTSSTTRCQSCLKTHNIKLLFSICCSQRFYLCKLNERRKRRTKAENVRIAAEATAAETSAVGD